MHFQHPTILLLLWLLPGVAALLVVAQKRRMAAARRFVEQPMMARLMPELHGSRPWTKGVLLLLGMTMLIIAAARPQYGVSYETVKQQHGVDCFVLLDVSRSMLAEDVAPNRLNRAKSDIRDLLKKLGGDRVGLIVFAGKPVLKAPLTTDAGFFNLILDDVDTRSAPRGGTLIGDAIRKALDSLPPRGDHDQMLVLLTDGEDQDSYPLDAAKQAAERGVKIFTVGLGDSSEGARIPVRDDSGKVNYVKEEGKEHWSKTDQGVLQQIAQATGGAHVSAGTRSYDLGQIYEDRIADLARGEEQQDVTRRRYNDQYQIFLALGLLLLMIERLLPTCSPMLRRCTSRASTMLLAVCVLGWTALGASPAEAAPGSASHKVEEGIQAFHGGDFKTASEAFGEAAEALPSEPRIAFDRGCAFAAEGENDKAVEQFMAAASAKNHDLAAMAHYNLGCLAIAKAKAKLGDKPEEAKPEVRKEILESFEQAACHLRDCLTVDPEHADARYNLETIRLWTKHIQEVWRQRDAQKRRQDMNLMQYLQWLEKEERELRAKDRPLAAERMSPRHREAIRAVENAQRELAEEIEPLKEKIHAAVTAPATPAAANGTPGGTTPGVATNPPADVAAQPPSPEAERALALLNKLADETRDAMNASADALAAQKPLDALKPQADAVEKIDSVFMVASPFVELVKKGIATEEGLIAQSKEASPSANADKAENAKNGEDEKTGDAEKKDQKTVDNNAPNAQNAQPGTSEADWSDAAWNQRFISNYGRVLAAKAKRELEQLAKTPEASVDGKEPANPQDAANTSSTEKKDEANDQANEPANEPANEQTDGQANEPGGPQAKGQLTPQQQQQKAEQQRKEMKRALQAGIDLAPKVVQLSDEAASQLDAAHPEVALPSQEETLKLLKEMLPKDQNKNDQDKNQQNQDKNNQDKKDQDKDKKDQDSKDKKDQDKKDQDKKDKDKKDQEKKDQDKKDDKKDQDQQKQSKADKQEKEKQAQQQKLQDPSKKQAEDAMREVRQRQQERREKEKILLEKLYRPERVEKDW